MQMYRTRLRLWKDLMSSLMWENVFFYMYGHQRPIIVYGICFLTVIVSSWYLRLVPWKGYTSWLWYFLDIVPYFSLLALSSNWYLALYIIPCKDCAAHERNCAAHEQILVFQRYIYRHCISETYGESRSIWLVALHWYWWRRVQNL